MATVTTGLKVFPNDTRLMSFRSIPVDFIVDSDVVLGTVEVDTTCVFPLGPVIVHHTSVLATPSVVPIAVVDNGTTNSNVTSSTTFTSAATNLATNMAIPAPYQVVTNGNELRLHITTKAVGQATTFRLRTSDVATLTFASAHGLVAGDQVWIKTIADTTYNGFVTVLDAPTTTTITYSNVGVDETSTADTTGRVGAHFALVHVPVFYF